MPRNKILDDDTKEELFLEYVYDEVNKNINEIISKYGHILDPKNNSLTKQYLSEHNDINMAYTQSFTTLFLLNMQIQKKTT